MAARECRWCSQRREHWDQRWRDGTRSERTMNDSSGHGPGPMHVVLTVTGGCQQGMTWRMNSSLLLGAGPAQRAQTWPQVQTAYRERRQEKGCYSAVTEKRPLEQESTAKGTEGRSWLLRVTWGGVRVRMVGGALEREPKGRRNKPADRLKCSPQRDTQGGRGETALHVVLGHCGGCGVGIGWRAWTEPGSQRSPDAELPVFHSSPSNPRRSETTENFAASFILLRSFVEVPEKRRFPGLLVNTIIQVRLLNFKYDLV